MNISNRYFRAANCDGDHDLYHQKTEITIISSVFFDFFAGFISLWFTIGLYRCIDIDHPVYSVIFSNNLLSTFLSGFTLIIKVIATQVKSCIPNFILIEIAGCVFSMNYICWMCVAFLRYYLLVVVKGQNNANAVDVDMIKLKKMASVCFWGIILGTSMVRFILDLMRYLHVLSITVRHITRSILFLIYPIATFGIYYKMDVSLRVKNKGTGDTEENQIDKSSISKKSNDLIPNQKDHESSPISMANYEVGVGKQLGKTKLDITSKAILTQNAPIRLKNRIRCMNKISPDASEKPFGGIYVGDDNQLTKNDTEDRDISSVTNVASRAKGNMNDDAQLISNILVDEEVRSLYTSGNEKQSAHVKNTDRSENVIEVSKERTSLRNTDLEGEVLQNERLMKYSTIQAEINSPKTELIRSSDKRLSKKHGTEETRMPQFHNMKSLSVAHPENHPSDTKTTRIDVLKCSEEESANNSSTSARGSSSNDMNNHYNEEEVQEANDYLESKEHKSILKAVLINCLYIGLMLIMGGILTVISKGNINNVVIIIMGSMLSLYRTFAPILSSIYCFEVIRVCSFNYLNEKHENLRDAYNIFRGLWR